MCIYKRKKKPRFLENGQAGGLLAKQGMFLLLLRASVIAYPNRQRGTGLSPNVARKCASKVKSLPRELQAIVQRQAVPALVVGATVGPERSLFAEIQVGAALLRAELGKAVKMLL